jgi:hypothetical protein
LSCGQAFPEILPVLEVDLLITYFFTLLQERMPHLFHKRDRENGQLVTCPDRVKTFSQLLKDKIDTNGDGRISKEEFIRGYCIWQMHIRKAKMHQVNKRKKTKSGATVFGRCRLIGANAPVTTHKSSVSSW